MKAVYLEKHAGPESIVVGQRPTPTPGPDEVRVRVHRAALNRVDLYMCGGGQGITHELPLILGVDGAGVIDAVGQSVAPARVGERVVIYPVRCSPSSEFSRRGDPMLCTSARVIGEHIDGTFAEYVCVPAVNALILPDAIDFEAAAALPTAYLTAWRMIFTKARLGPGETVLIHGVGGGVSCAALQLAKLAGAYAIVTSSRDEKLERAAALGADTTINYRREDVLEQTLAATGGRGVDVVFENVGEATWASSLKALVRGGRLVVCGATTGAQPKADLQRVFIRQLQILGSTLGNYEELRRLLRGRSSSKAHRAGGGTGISLDTPPIFISPNARVTQLQELAADRAQFGKLLLARVRIDQRGTSSDS